MVKILAIVFACGLLFGVAGCGDNKPALPHDAGTDDIDAGSGTLERPPVLPRPPKQGLPADLRPPR
ncbi:MAG TPA: hypothetical protein VFG83_15250 [Kofleriaceae bacterium]|nr:hypothetical protein [Kofleriaceae bacterium]